jgi:TrmH family RNA methyltransferase
MGSALRMPIMTTTTVEGAVSDARANGLPIVATVPRDGVPLVEADLEGAAALLIGGEGAGLPFDVIRNADRRITIPMEHPVESLNAAVATAIVLYEARRQRAIPAVRSGRRLSARG